MVVTIIHTILRRRLPLLLLLLLLPLNAGMQWGGRAEMKTVIVTTTATSPSFDGVVGAAVWIMARVTCQIMMPLLPRQLRMPNPKRHRTCLPRSIRTRPRLRWCLPLPRKHRNRHYWPVVKSKNNFIKSHMVIPALQEMPSPWLPHAPTTNAIVTLSAHAVGQPSPVVSVTMIFRYCHLHYY